MRQVYDLFDGQEKIENLMADFLNNRCFQIWQTVKYWYFLSGIFTE